MKPIRKRHVVGGKSTQLQRWGLFVLSSDTEQSLALTKESQPHLYYNYSIAQPVGWESLLASSFFVSQF